MADVERTTSWQQIQQGVKEAENLIVRKEYNLVMIKARQTLEFMVRCLAEKACLVEGDLSDTIDQLYEGRWIDKRTKDNFHTIRILGNKAVHEGDDTAYDANQAYQILAQEVHAFSDEIGGRSQRSRTASRGTASARSGGSRSAGASERTGSRGGQGRTPQQRGSYSGAVRSGGNRRRKKKTPPTAYVLRILIPVLVVILLVIVIRMLIPGGGSKDPAATTPETTEATEVSTAETEPETPPETTAPAERYRVKGSSVNVRMEPSTDSRILVQLTDGTEVTYVKRYNNEWTVINYDGQEAYVSSQFIEKVTPETTEETPAAGDAQENGESAAQ